MILWSTGYKFEPDGTKIAVRRPFDLDNPALYSITNEGGWSGGWQIYCDDAPEIVDDWQQTIAREGRIRQANAPEPERLYVLAPTVGAAELAKIQQRKREIEQEKWLAELAQVRKTKRRNHPHYWTVDYNERRNTELAFAIQCDCGMTGWYVLTGHDGFAAILPSYN